MLRPTGGRLVFGLLASSCFALPLDGQQMSSKGVAPRAPTGTPSAAAAADPVVYITGNELGCAVTARGDVCAAATFTRGAWPLPVSTQYIYGAGLTIAGIVGEGAPAEWAGDTIASYFFDGRGTQYHAAPLTGVHDSRSPADLAAWPSAGDIAGFPFASGNIGDDLFHGAHLGRRAASDQDTWAIYWDGDPALSYQREHPLGIAVEQRTMQWTGPEGLQSVIFVVYRLTNVTDLTVFRDTIAAAYFGGDSAVVPAAGWGIDSLFVGFSMDADVTSDAFDNRALLLPGMEAALTYDPDFVDYDTGDYPADVFHEPFLGRSPGLVASALLHADADPATGESRGLRVVSVTENPGSCIGLCDPLGVDLWRYLSGHWGPFGDACNVADPEVTRACYARVPPGDVRHYQSTGPYSLRPGESVSVVFAMVTAPTVDVPGLVVGGDNPPEMPSAAPGCDGDPIGTIAAAAGWVSTPECPMPGERLDADAVETVPGSLLHRIQVARALVAAGFLTPRAPDAPPFHVLPADSAVLVVWSDDPAGLADPFHDVARDSTSALYNPNYRRFDVEGYRVYRSTDGRNWREVAQFDYDTTTFVDVLCETDRTHPAGDPCTEPRWLGIHDRQWPNDQPFVQYRPGDVVRTANGNVAVLGADTASAEHLPMGNGGVPFAWEDHDVRAGFRYHYQVRAFDVNSYRSGPSSLESSAQIRSAIAQPRFQTLVDPVLTLRIEGADGVALDPSVPLPAIDSLTGVFDGPMPPTNALVPTFLPDLPRLLPAFRLEMRIDSVRLGPTPEATCTGATDQLGACWRLFYTLDRDGVRTAESVGGYTPVWDAFGGPGRVEMPLFTAEVQADSATLATLDASPDAFAFTARVDASFDESIFNSASEGQANRRSGGSGIPAGVPAGGSRWFDGEEETVPDPTRFIRVGHLSGVDTVWAPVHHTNIGDGTTYPASGSMQCYSYAVSGIARVADIRVTWRNGTITAEDVTHGVPVEFKPTGQQSWGFVRDGNGNGMIDWQDFDHIDGIAPVIRQNGFCYQPAFGGETQLSSTPVVLPTSTQGVASGFASTGRGFGLYINAQRFIFETPGGARPADGTVWTLRNYHGYVTAATGPQTMDPSDYSFSQTGSGGLVQLRPPMVPGLRVIFESQSGPQFVGAPDLTRIHTVPDPFYYHARFGVTEQGRLIRFVNLPPQATIRIYSVAGVLVDVIHHDDPLSGIATWDVRTREGATPASGVYFFHVTAPDGVEHVGRFTIVTSWRVAQ